MLPLLLLPLLCSATQRPALRLRGGSSPATITTPILKEEPAVAAPNTGQKPPRKWPPGSGLVIALLYSAGLFNGLARRTFSCASPVLEGEGWLTKPDIEGIHMFGYQSFALGRIFAAPIILRLGSKRALLLQLVVLALSCAGFCAAEGRREVQTYCWAAVRFFSAMTISIMLPLVRLWVPRDAYGRVWGLLQSGVQTGGLLAYTYYGQQLSRGAGSWRAPFALAAGLGALTALACALLLRPAPAVAPPSATAGKPHARGGDSAAPTAAAAAAAAASAAGHLSRASQALM